MSQYATIRTRIVDRDALVAALHEAGFEHVEVYETPQHLHGYVGDRRRRKTQVIIPRRCIGRLSNDVGFLKQRDGTYQAIISGYDRARFSDQWLNKLTQSYAVAVAKSRLSAEGFTLLEETRDEAGAVHILVRRAV